MKSSWLLCGMSFGLCLSQSSHADLLALQIEPIIGFEHVQQLLPTIHSVNRLIYGARATAGIPMVSAEAEYTHGTLQEDFPGISQNSVSDRLKVGLRTGIGLGSLINVAFRGGVQASQTQTTQIISGVTSTTYDPLRYDPYAGASLNLSLSRKMNASVSVVAVFRDINHLDQNEYQTTAGFAIRFP
jgi:hypothetical protein